MNKKVFSGCLTAMLVMAGIVVLSSAAYTVNMREQVIITQFGDPKGEPVTEAGLQLLADDAQFLESGRQGLLHGWEAGNALLLGDAVVASRDKTKIHVTAEEPFSKR